MSGDNSQDLGGSTSGSGGSCPIGVTFGPTVTLSPSGETVLNARTSYFNNGDYVVIWTEKTSTGPRLEFQLFQSNNTKVGCTTVSCPGELVTAPGLRIGTTLVGVYEDYRFAIAYSTLTRTGAPWQISVQTYQYNVESANYQALNTYLSLVSSSNRNDGRFGFATLSLDNAFIIATLKDRYNLQFCGYNLDNTSKYTTNPFVTQAIKSSDVIEIELRAVPTQYFFTAAWSPLNKDGIFIQNYNITDGSTVITTGPVNIAQNSQPIAYPLHIYLDLSYGGTIAVAWQASNDQCNLQQFVPYNAQMLQDTGIRSNSFAVSSPNTADPEDANIWMQQIIAQSPTRIIATFFQQQSGTYFVKIFDNTGILVTSNNEIISTTTPPPAYATTGRVLLQVTPEPTPVPLPPAGCRQREDLETVPTGESAASRGGRVERTAAEVPPPLECSAYKALQIVCGGTEDQREILLQIVNNLILKLNLVGATFPPYSSNEQVLLLFLGNTLVLKLPKLSTGTYTRDAQYYFSKATAQYKINLYAIRYNIGEYINLLYRGENGIFVSNQFIALDASAAANKLGQYCFQVYTNTAVKNLGQCASITTGMKEATISAVEELSRVIKPTMEGGCYVNVFNFDTSYNSVCEAYQYTTPSGRNWNICSDRSLKASQNFNTIDVLIAKITGIVDKLIDMSDAELTAQGQTYVNIHGDILRSYLATYKAGLSSLDDIVYYYAPESCPESWIGGYTTTGISLSGVFFCQNYLHYPLYPVLLSSGTFQYASAFHLLAHELTHRYLSTTDIDASGRAVYGISECQTWASTHPPFDSSSPSSLVIADCLTLVISRAYASSTLAGRIAFEQSINNQQSEHAMIRRTDILFNITAHATYDRVVTSVWSLTNLSPNDYHIGRGVLMLDGAAARTFYITGPSTIQCHSVTHSSHYVDLMHIKSRETQSSSILISSICSFSEALPGTYTIHVRGSFVLYPENDIEAFEKSLTNESTEYSWLLGNATFVIGENSEDLALKSLTYESGL